MASAPAVIVNLPGFPFDNFPSLPTIAALRLVSVGSLSAGDNYVVDGGAASGDGSGGIYTWAPSSLAVDNGTTIVKPNSLTVGQAGRWRLVDASTGAGTARLRTPLDFGAVGDGFTDDTAALTAFFAAAASGEAMDLLSRRYRFLSPLAFQGSSVSITGSQAVLLYDGDSSTPGNLITFGSLGYSAQDIEFKGWGVRSNRALANGAAVKIVSAFDVRCDLDLYDVNLFDGLWFDHTSLISLLFTKIKSSNRQLMWNDGVELRCDNLYLKGKVPETPGSLPDVASGVGITVGGGCGGFYDLNVTQLFANKGLVIDNSLSAASNSQIFWNGVYDTNYSVNVELNDTTTPAGAKLVRANGWAATALNGPSVRIKSWPGAWVLVGPAKILNSQAGPGIQIDDPTVKLGISDSAYISSNNGYGVQASAAVTISCDATMEANAAGNFSPLVSVRNTQYGTSAIVQSPSSGWLFDTTPNALTVANGSSGLLADGSGLVTVSNPSNGDVGLYILGGGVAVLVSSTLGSWVASTTSPAGGKASIAFSGGRYSIYNNFGSSQGFLVAMLVRTRVSG